MNLKLRGKIIVDHYRDNVLLSHLESHNLFTTLGLNHILDITFGAGAQVTPWYIGLINNDPDPTLLAADTLAAHTGWEELVPSTDYTGNRQEWLDAAAASGTKASSSVATFPILTTQEIYGICIASVAVGSSGLLMSEGAFDAPIPVVLGDDIKVSYSIEAASS